jgi:hypothetical protein
VALEVETPKGKRRPFGMMMEAVLERTGGRRPDEPILDWRERVKEAMEDLMREIDESDVP